MSDNHANSAPSTWDPNFDAVIAAPKHHKVIFENDRLRVLDVTLEPNDEEPLHHHRWPSVFVLDSIHGHASQPGLLAVKGSLLMPV